MFKAPVEMVDQKIITMSLTNVVMVPSLLNLNKFNTLVKCYNLYFEYDYFGGAWSENL